MSKQNLKSLSTLKLLRCFILSFSLILTQLSLTLSAEESSIEEDQYSREEENTVIVNQPTQIDRTQLGADPEKQKFTEEKHDVDEDNMLEYLIPSLAMFLSGAVLAKCGNLWSARVFAITSAGWLLMETMNYQDYEGASERSMEAYRYYNDAEENHKQITSLLEAAAQTEEAADAVEQKSKYAMYAAIGFGVAAALALVEEMSTFMPSECTGGLFGHKPISNPYYASLFPQSFENYQENKNFINDLKSFQQEEYFLSTLDSSQSPQESMQVFTNWHAQRQGLQNSIHLYDQFYEQDFTGNQEVSLQSQKSFTAQLKKFISQAHDAVIPRVQASTKDEDKKDDDSGGLGKFKKVGFGAIAGIGGYFLATQTEAMNMLENGYLRAALFGATAAGAFWLHTQLKGDAELLRENAENYRKLAEKLKVNTDMDTGEFTHSIPLERQLITGSQIDKTGRNTNSFCMVTRNGKDLIDEACACRQNNSCKPPSLPNPDFHNFDMPGIVSDSIDQMRDIESHLNNGNLEAAENGINSFNGNQNAIRDLNRQLEDHINSNLDSPIDFQANRDAARDKLKEALRKDLKRMPAPAFNQLASMGPSSVSPPSQAGPKQENIDEGLLSDSYNNSNQSGTSANESSSKANQKKDPFSGFSFTGGGSNSGSDSFVDPNSLAANMDKFDFEHSGRDISSEDKNLFKIITGRYFRSAYPIIFESKED